MTGWIVCSLLLTSLFQDSCQHLLTNACTRGLKSECGTGELDAGRSRAAFASASASELPTMPMWLGTHTNLILWPELCRLWRDSRISRTRGFWTFLFSIEFRQDNESDRIRKCLHVDCSTIFRARITARASAEKIDAWSGSLFTRTDPLVTAAADTLLPFLDPSVKIFLYPSYTETSSL